MRRRTVWYSLGAAMLAFGLGACSTDSITNALQDSVTQAQEQADIAQAAGDAAVQNLDLMYNGADGAMASFSTSRTPGLWLDVRSNAPRWAFSQYASNCPYDTDTGRHNCDPIDVAPGLILTSSYAFFAAGQWQETFDQATTDSINLDGLLQGTVSNANDTANVNRHLNVTVARNPQWDQQRVWSGTVTDTSDATLTNDQATRSYALKTATTIANVVVAEPRGENPYPLSGTIMSTISGSRTREGNTTVSKNVAYTAVVTFNGTSIVPLDVGPSADNLTGHFCVDLAQRKLAQVSGCRAQ